MRLNANLMAVRAPERFKQASGMTARREAGDLVSLGGRIMLPLLTPKMSRFQSLEPVSVLVYMTKGN